MSRRLVLLFRLLWVLLWLVIFEVGASWWIESKGNALDRTRAVVWADPVLGWRQRPNLQTTFYEQPLQTNELGLRAPSMEKILAAKRLVLVLGPSSAFGWGVQERETYSAALEELIAKENAGEVPLVVNAGEIGFSSFQGRKLFELPEFGSLRPEWVVIAYGVNDVDRHRFYFQSPEPDRLALAAAQNDTAVFAYRLLARSKLVSLLYKLAGLLRGTGPKESQGKQPLRVSEADYSENLTALFLAAKARGARVLMLETPLHLSPDTLQQPEAMRIKQDVARYNEIARAAAKRENVTYVPVLEALSRDGLGRSFVDPVHPSAQGHRTIAQELIQRMKSGTKKQ